MVNEGALNHDAGDAGAESVPAQSDHAMPPIAEDKAEEPSTEWFSAVISLLLTAVVSSAVMLAGLTYYHLNYTLPLLDDLERKTPVIAYFDAEAALDDLGKAFVTGKINEEDFRVKAEALKAKIKALRPGIVVLDPKVVMSGGRNLADLPEFTHKP